LLFGFEPRVVVWSPYTSTSVSEILHCVGALVAVFQETLVHTGFGDVLLGFHCSLGVAAAGVKSIKEMVVPG
jgi:hypothetical protein